MKEIIELQLDEYEQGNMTDLKKAMLKEDLEGLDGINEGEVKLNHVYSFPKDGGVEVGCFLRNASASEVFFGEVSIKIMDKNDGSCISEGKFDLNSKFKGIGKNKGRYFDLFFSVDEDKNLENESIELIWGEDLEIGETKEVAYTFLEGLGEEKQVVQEFISELSPMKEDSVNVDCFSMKKVEDGGVDFFILVRNTCESAIALKKIRIDVTEAGEFVAGGSFRTEFIKVDACEGKMFRFPMKKENILKNDIDFEKCEVKIS